MLISVLVASTLTSAAYADEIHYLPFDTFVSGDLGRSNYRGEELPHYGDSDFNLRASSSYQNSNKFGAQFDGVYSKRNLGKANISTADLVSHLFYRNDRFLVGVFGQYRNPKLNMSTGDISADISADFFSNLIVSEQAFWGAEGQAYFGDITVSGQLAKQEFINQKDLSGQKILNDGYVASIKTRYFVKDNWKVEASYAYNNVNLYQENLDQNTFGVATEYRFTDTPVSLYAQYNRNEQGASDLSIDSNQILAGLKINFGSTTLKTLDRSGASLDPVSQSSTEALLVGNLIGNLFNFIPR